MMMRGQTYVCASPAWEHRHKEIDHGLCQTWLAYSRNCAIRLVRSSFLPNLWIWTAWIWGVFMTYMTVGRSLVDSESTAYQTLEKLPPLPSPPPPGKNFRSLNFWRYNRDELDWAWSTRSFWVVSFKSLLEAVRPSPTSLLFVQWIRYSNCNQVRFSLWGYR